MENSTQPQPAPGAVSETHSEWSRRVGAHCPVCGEPITGTCTSCAALPCRADTTDPVAPDPPCLGYRRQTAAGHVMTPAVTRPYFGSTLILAVPPGADEADVERLRDHLAAAAADDRVTVVAVRGIEALRTWEPQPAPDPSGLRADLIDAMLRWSGRDRADTDECASELAAILDRHPMAQPAPGFVTCDHSPAELGVTVSGEPQPAPELAAAIKDIIDRYPEDQPAPGPAADADRLRRALENVFAVLDRQTRTYAERISHARTLIRTALEGK